MKNWIEEAIFYHIYPLGFCNAPQYHQEQITHSITKIKEWIPHFKQLNINALYLGPIFESYEHGYDTSDYQLIDHRLGTNKDFKDVCDALHEAKIHIVLDGVFNHVGRNFWAFLDVKEKREQSKYVSWFSNLRFDGNNDANDGFYYDTWQGHTNLVKLNLQNEEVVQYLFESIEMWMKEFHIDGLRLDAADVMDRNFFKRLKQFCKNKQPDFWLMGEIIHGNYTVWANDEMLDSVTNYECYKGIYSSHNDHNYFEIAHSLQRQFANGGIYQNLRLYNFVDNHDVNRVASTVTNKKDLENIYTLLYTMPGIPSVYYGSEWAVEGKKAYGSDANLRPALSLQTAIPLTKHIAKLGEIRKKHSVFYHGTYQHILLKNEQLIFKRESDTETVYIALNVADTNATMQIQSESNLIDEISNEIYASKDGNVQFTLAPKQSAILTKTPKNTKPKPITKPIQPPQPIKEEIIIVQPPKEVIKHNDQSTLPLGRYQHFKGKHYCVLYVATHSETQEAYVVYRALYGDCKVWVRPLSMFLETVEHQGISVPRFTYIGK